MASQGYLPTERHGFTEPQPIPPFPPPPPPKRPRVFSRRDLGIAGGALAASFVLGILIGRCSSSHAAAPTEIAAAPASTLAVASKPADGNVVLDGRFVGVSPIDHLSVDPGAHTVVVDVFGYQPYAGRLQVDPQTNLKVSVTLVPIGGTGTTTGTATGTTVASGGPGAPGGGSSGAATPILTPVPVPKSALAPAAPAAGSGSAAGAPAKRRSSSYTPSYTPSYDPPPAYTPPPRPKRDCSSEKSRCRDGCSHAEFECRSNCPTCVSCSSSIGSDQCRIQCDSCRGACDSNTKFCESSCDSNYDNCEASNRD